MLDGEYFEFFEAIHHHNHPLFTFEGQQHQMMYQPYVYSVPLKQEHSKRESRDSRDDEIQSFNDSESNGSS
jgi:hypothetical protein